MAVGTVRGGVVRAGAKDAKVVGVEGKGGYLGGREGLGGRRGERVENPRGPWGCIWTNVSYHECSGPSHSHFTETSDDW